MDLWLIILIAVVLVVAFIVAGLRTLHRENRKELRGPQSESFGDNPDPPGGTGRS